MTVQKLQRKLIVLTFFTVAALLTPHIGFAAWPADSTVNVPISTAADEQRNPRVASDGSGGAIITWGDFRSGTDRDIYAQRINADGVVQWTANGAAISTATNEQRNSRITSDGSGGATITWGDFRSGTDRDIYAQRVDSTGTVQWTANGVAISTATNDQENPRITSDGSGGAIITWGDLRDGLTDKNIYAQRVNSSGVVQWTADGVAIVTSTNNQENPQIASDGASGAIISWGDFRNGATNKDIYAQRIDSAGTVQWTADGVAIVSSASNQENSKIASDNVGGALISWGDLRNGAANKDIYTQRINSTGTVQWTADGVAVSTAANNQRNPHLISDGSGGAILAWGDFRSGTNRDIYAQRVFADSSLPVTLASFTATASEGKIEVRWRVASEVNNVGFTLYRRANETGGFEKLGWIRSTAGSVGSGDYNFKDDQVNLGDTYFYFIEDVDIAGNTTRSQIISITFEPQLVQPDAIPVHFALYQNYPNPFNPETWIPYDLADDVRVQVEIYDTQGNRIRTLAVGHRPAGSYLGTDQAAYWDGRSDKGEVVSSGVYFYHLHAGDFYAVKKMIVLK